MTRNLSFFPKTESLVQFANAYISFKGRAFTVAHAFVLLICLSFLQTISYSQEIEPRNYANVPVNMNLAALTYSLSQGSVVADASSPIQDLDLTSHSIVATYLRTFSLFGKLAKVQINMPYTFVSGSAKLRGVDTSATRSGFADARFKIE